MTADAPAAPAVPVPRVHLHESGPEVSALIWGTMRLADQFDGPTALARFLGGLLDRGVTTLDTADIYTGYGNEALLGAGLADLGSAARGFEIITKCGIALLAEARPHHRIKHYNASADHIRGSVDASLAALGVERIDLLLIHRPDELMAVEETAAALDAVVAAGKVGHVGVSNHAPPRLDLLAGRLATPVATNQIEFSPIQLAPLGDGTLDQAQMRGFRPMIWSPTGGGRLLSAGDDRARRLRERLGTVAATMGLEGPGEAALAWVLRHPAAPVPVLGTGRPARIDAAIATLAAPPMDRQDWYAILEASLGRAVA
ncbi:MAG: oxidoreductase [Alphaproteobacteria bacterium]|jgi:predicted oxidoreductase|nr:oxidoreductase [Alphaproteobacteria bacterium]